MSNLLFSADYWDFYLLLAHTYHFRYLVLLLILSYYYNFSKYESPIIYGIILSIVLLFFESLINTYMTEGERLVSGSLGNNSYANIIAAIMFFFIWLRKHNQMSRKIIYPILVLLLIIILATQTRMALIAPFFVLLAYFIYNLKQNFLLRFVKLIAILSIFFFTYMFLVKSDYVPKRYSIEPLLDSNVSGLVLENNEESSSLFTRFMLFKTSFEMIKDKPLTGIGVGRFNRYKKDFGFKYNVLIDSHNDLLALMCQYGILTGLLLLFIITILPLIYYLRYLKGNINNKLVFLFIINFSMLFAGLSNAGLLKHQIFAFLAFNLIVTNSLVSSLKIR
jgi:O-antigen ligase